MAAPLVPDALWGRIEPLLPPPKPRRHRYPGRRPLTNRQALTGILFVLKTGIRWNDLPREMGCGSGSRCRRRLQEWHRAGVWQALHAALLAELQEADKIDWSRAAVDSSFVRARGGGGDTGRNPTDRGKSGSKHHAVVDAHSIPLAATVIAGWETASSVPVRSVIAPRRAGTMTSDSCWVAAASLRVFALTTPSHAARPAPTTSSDRKTANSSPIRRSISFIV